MYACVGWVRPGVCEIYESSDINEICVYVISVSYYLCVCVIFNFEIFLKLTCVESTPQDVKSCTEMMVSMTEKCCRCLPRTVFVGLGVSSFVKALLTVVKKCPNSAIVYLNFAKLSFDLCSHAFNVHPQATEARSFEQLVILGRRKGSSISCADKIIYSLFDKAGVSVISYS